MVGIIGKIIKAARDIITKSKLTPTLTAYVINIGNIINNEIKEFHNKVIKTLLIKIDFEGIGNDNNKSLSRAEYIIDLVLKIDN